MILPKSKGRVIKTDALSFIPYKPFTSDKDYKKAIKEEGKDPKKYSLPKRPTTNFQFYHLIIGFNFMRAEIENKIIEIKKSMKLLRRHL